MSIEKELRNTMDREVYTRDIGELVMEKLKNFDGSHTSALLLSTASLLTSAVSVSWKR